MISLIWLVINILGLMIILLRLARCFFKEAKDTVDSFIELLKSIKLTIDTFHDLWKKS